MRYGANSPAYPVRIKYYRDRITGLRGSSESGGFHGDGIDWFEFEMTPDLANDLRTRLTEIHSDQVTRNPTGPTGDKNEPNWWPTRWPADAICYAHKDSLAQLILTPNGTRGWFRNFRW